MAPTKSRKAKPVAYSTVAERAAEGKAARAAVPRDLHAHWAPAANRRDPVEILESQGESRVPELLPIRHGRMAASAFAFFRGAAAVMSADLAMTSTTPLRVQLCGDAHLANFGGFASPERDLVFDLNDFDETAPGPFEWDVKRLAASFEVATRDRGIDRRRRREIVGTSVRTYRQSLRDFSKMNRLDLWYSRLDLAAIVRRFEGIISNDALRSLERNATKAQSKNHLKAFSKLVVATDGELRFASDPPLLVPVREVFADADAQLLHDTIADALERYRSTLAEDRRRLFDGYRFVDLARKVVGVGSVGTRCWVALLVGRDADDPMFLQVKQAERSVLEDYAGDSAFANHGQRVVEGQRLVQAASDILLGWDRVTGVDGVARDFYMRQLWDWKVSAALETMAPELFMAYGQLCGWTLARAHARAGDAVAIGSYLGGSDAFDRALVAFASSYADQNEADHGALVDAIAGGRVPARSGI